MTRLTFLIIISSLTMTGLIFAADARSQNLKEINVSLTVKNGSLKTVITQLEKQSGLRFVYTEALGNRTGISISAHKRSLATILTELSEKQKLRFDQVNSMIAIVDLREEKSQQTGKLSGVVVDEHGQTLPGVSLKIMPLNRVLQTNADGQYLLSLNPGSYTVEASFVSYEKYRSAEIMIRGGQTTALNITMKAAVGQLDEILVTALGIKREEKSLGYSAQKLNENVVKDAKTNNWVSALSGKVAGLNIVGTGSGPMGSSRITLRGESSLNLDNNQALIVIDGIPVSSKITGTGYKAHLGADSPVDFGSDVSDINPDDIENITVLKGAGATALYGSRAANGALLITTKSGKRKVNGIGVTYNSNISFDQINRWPDYQFEYGEGRTDAYYSYLDSKDGPNTSTSVGAGRAWGPKFNGQPYYQYDPNSATGQGATPTPWLANKGYISDFFRTGVTTSNNVSIEGSDDKSSARFSVTHLKNEWIMPNTGFERLSAALSVNHQVSDKLKITAKVNYTNKKSDNLPLAGYNNQTIMYFMIIGTAPNIDINWFKPYWEAGQENVQQRNPFYRGPDNPYLQVYEMLNKMNKHGVVGNVAATYQITPKLDLMVRSGIDMSYEFRSQQRPYSMTKYAKGMYREQNVFNYEMNTDALLSYKDQINSDIKYSVAAGGNDMRQRYNFAGIYADQLAQPGVYQLSNSLDQAVADPSRLEKAINSVYALSQFSWREKIFLDLTGRNDWSSTLPFKNNSFFYPSVNTSFIISELAALPQAISFAKLRLSWAQVGNDTRPYQTAKYYDKVYSNSFTNPATLFNADLKPEITSSYEAGADMRFLKNRIGMDVAVYRNDSRNQILEVPLDDASGYTKALLNAGLIRSKGLEVMLTGKPVVGNNFSWTTTVTWSRNRSYVKELSNGITSQILASHETNATIEARVGGRMGDIYGKGFQRSPDGKIIYNSSGVPAELDVITKKLGNVFADWKGGWMNEFNVGKFRISVLLDAQKGGSVFSQTNHKLNTFGKTKVTLEGREGGLIGDGVVLTPAGTYVPNTTRVSSLKYFEEYYKIANAETNIFDASYVKLRETRVAYTFPKNWMGKVIKDCSIAVYGRDLFVISKFPGFDPEAANLNSGSITPGIELAQFPSTRTMGFNLTVKF